VKPGQAYAEQYRNRAHHHPTTLKTKQKQEIKARAHKRKMYSLIQSSGKKARKEYGKQVLDVIPDIHQAELEDECQRFVVTHINLTNDKLGNIENLTENQSLSVTWIEERKNISSIKVWRNCEKADFHDNWSVTGEHYVL